MWFLPNSRSGGCSAGCPDPPFPSPHLFQLHLMGSDELIPHQRGFLHRGWREGNPPCQQLPALTQPHWLLDQPFPSLHRGAWCGSCRELVHGYSCTIQTSKHPNFGSVGRPTRAAAQVGSITALNDNLVFCCVFLRGCMPDQTAFLGLHPIFILFITPSDKGCLSVRLIFFQDTVLFYALLSL